MQSAQFLAVQLSARVLVFRNGFPVMRYQKVLLPSSLIAVAVGEVITVVVVSHFY
jgi:hypothetical protein